MMIEIKNVSSKIWDETLKNAGPSGTIFQTTFWADYLKKAYGDRPIYLAYLDKKGAIIGQLLAVESCYGKHTALTQFGTKGRIIEKFYKYASKLLHNTFPFVFWEGGPVIIDQSSHIPSFKRKMVHQEIINRITEIAMSRGCYEVKFARPSYFDDPSDIFFSIGFEGKKMGTVLVDLERSEDELFKSIEKDCRRCIRRGIEQGIEASKISKVADLKQLYSLHVEHSKRSGIKIYPYSHFTSLWNHFYPIGKLAAFISYRRDEPLAGMLCLMHNRIVHAYRIGESNYARTAKLYANYVLWWHIIRWAHKQGFKYFDCMGVELYKINAGYQKALTIYRFKNKWGNLIKFNDYNRTFYTSKVLRLLNHFMADYL
jgi:hypothetical protein